MIKTQIERINLRSKDRDVINFDPAIVTMGRFDDNQELQYTCNRYRSSNEQYYDTSHAFNYQCQTHIDDQQQMNVVEQMIAQPHIPYALLPKHFKPKQISNNRNQQQSSSLNNNHDDTRRFQRQKHFTDNNYGRELMFQRQWVPTNRYYEPCRRVYYNSYSYQLPQNRSHRSKNIIPSYEINRWQEPYTRSPQQRNGFRHRRNNDDCIREDHRINQSRNDKGAKAYKINDNDY